MEGAVEAAVTGHLHAGLNISSHSLQSWGDAKPGGMQAFWVETFLGSCMPPCLFYPRPPLSCLGAQLGLILLSHCHTHGGAAQASGKVAWCQARR